MNDISAKSGIIPKDCVEVVRSIITNNTFLQFCGLMTIGDPNAAEEQPDFRVRLFQLNSQFDVKVFENLQG